VANITALQGVVFHIMNDAMMVTCLFLVAGQVKHQTGGHAISDFKNFFKTMPITASIFTVGALAVIGVPPTCGFFSKWYLLLGAIQAHQWSFVTALLVCTLINVALFFKVFDKGLYAHTHKNAQGSNRPEDNLHNGEAPLSMLIPASVLAVVIILVGVFNQGIINKVIHLAVPPGF